MKKDIIGSLELPLLIFPVLVTCIVACGFVLGLSCSIWEWWLAVLLSMGAAFLTKRKMVDAAVGSLCFVLVLFALWIVSHLFCTNVGVDDMTYHFPAIRLIARGWNPVMQCTPQKIEAAFGISPEIYRATHMLSMPKGVWYFCAAFNQFSGAHFNLYFPITLLIFISLLYVVFNVFHALGRWVVLGVVAAICVYLFYGDFPCVDAVIALSAVGLLATMANRIKNGEWRIIHMFVFSFWMCVSKQTAMLHAVVFWIVFLTTLLILRQRVFCKQVLVILSLVGMTSGIVCISPYVTSYVSYGSPFYPRYSGDEEKYPVQNQTADFLVRNDDAAAMGHVGAYLNAFVSPWMMRQYYEHKTVRKGDGGYFCPMVQAWGPSHYGAPTSLIDRIAFCMSLIVLFLFCGTAGVFVAMAIIMGTLAMPTEMIGFLRYTPWALFGGVFCVGLVNYSKLQKALIVGFYLIAFGFVPLYTLYFVYAIDRMQMVRQLLESQPPEFLLCQHTLSDIPRYAHVNYAPYGRKEYAANLELLKANVPALIHSRVVIDARQVVKDIDSCHDFAGCGFNVVPTYGIDKYSALSKIDAIPSFKDRLIPRGLFVLRTLFVTLPQGIWKTLTYTRLSSPGSPI